MDGCAVQEAKGAGEMMNYWFGETRTKTHGDTNQDWKRHEQ